MVGSYLVLDPFQVLYHYDAFATQGMPNRDYVTFINNYPRQPYRQPGQSAENSLGCTL